MRMTIISSDSLVAINSVTYAGLDLSSLGDGFHALQWYDTWGEIEYKVAADGTKPHNEVISSLDGFQHIVDEWQIKHDAATAPPAPLTDDQLKLTCKDAAKQLLADSDWSQLPDAQASLQNAQAFNDYRAILREYLINPVTAPQWPVVPTAVWVAA